MKECVVTIHPSDVSIDTISQDESLALGYSSLQQAEGAEKRRSWLSAHVEKKPYGSSVIESPKIEKYSKNNTSLAMSSSSMRSLDACCDRRNKQIYQDNQQKIMTNKIEIDIQQLSSSNNIQSKDSDKSRQENDKSRRASTQIIIPTNLLIPEEQPSPIKYGKKSTRNQTSVFNEGEMIKSLQTNNNNNTFNSNNNFKQGNNNNLNKKKGKQAFFSLFNFTIMKEIVAHIKNHVISRRFADLSKKNFDQINDLAALTHETKQSKGTQLLEYTMNWIPQIPVFSSDSPVFIAWNVTIFFTIIFQVFMIPLEVSFNVSFGNGDFFLGIIYVVEMITNFNSSYFEEGIAVHDRKKIIFKYIKQQFWLDLLTSLAFFFNTNHKIFALDLIFMIRISNIPNIFKDIEQFFQFYRHQAFIDFVTLLFWTALMAHYLGCGFHYISISSSHSWIKLMNIENSEWFVRYVYSIYFSFVTMSTIGYGDIYPVSVEEKIYVIAMLIIGSGWFAYVVNKAGQIFSEIQFRKKKVSQKQYLILDYMRNRNVSKNLQLKVVKYLDFVDSKESEDSSHGEKILETMSNDLKEQILRDCYKPILKKHFVFRNLFSDQFLEKLVTHMHEMSLGPGEVLVNQMDTERVLFFIKEGSVDLVFFPFQKAQPSTISTINKNEFLGSDQFFQIIHCSPYSALCKQSCQLIYLSLESFLETAKHFPQDLVTFKNHNKFIYNLDKKEKYYMTRDKGMWNQALNECDLCGNGKHPFAKCPAVFFNPKNLLLICKLNKNTPHNERSFFRIRNTFRSSNTLHSRSNVQQITRYYRRHLEQSMLGQEETASIECSSSNRSADDCNKNGTEPVKECMHSNILSADGSPSPNQNLFASFTEKSKGIQSQNQTKKYSGISQKPKNELQKKSPRTRRQTKKHSYNLQKSLFAGSDKDFFKDCIQFEFINNVLQQCSEYESDSEESEEFDIYNNEQYTHKSPEFTRTEKDVSDEKRIEPQIDNSQTGKDIQEEKDTSEQISSIGKDSGALIPHPTNKSMHFTTTNNNNLSVNRVPKQIQLQRGIYFQKSISITTTPVPPQPQQNNQPLFPTSPQFAFGDLKPASAISFNIANPPESLLMPSSEDGENTLTKLLQTPLNKRKSKMPPKNQLEQSKNSKPGKKRTYPDPNNPQVHDYGFSQIDNPMQSSIDLIDSSSKPSNNQHQQQYPLSKYSTKYQINIPNTSPHHIASQLQETESPILQNDEQTRSINKKHILTFSQAPKTAFQNVINQQDEIYNQQQQQHQLSIVSPNESSHPIGGSGSQGQHNQTLNYGQVTQLKLLEQAGIQSRWNHRHPMLHATTGVTSCQNYRDPQLSLQFSCISHFDEMKRYQVYFPSYNYSQVLKKCRKLNQTKIKQINQQKRIKKISKENNQLFPHQQQQNLRNQGTRRASFQIGNNSTVGNMKQLSLRKYKVNQGQNSPTKFNSPAANFSQLFPKRLNSTSVHLVD